MSDRDRVLFNMKPLVILQVPRHLSKWEEHRGSLVPDFVIRRRSTNEPPKVFRNDQQVEEFDFGRYKEVIIDGEPRVHVRVYDRFDNEDCNQLCSDFLKPNEKNFLIIVQCNDVDARKSILCTIKETDLRNLVILTNQESGDISFMPLQTFERTEWVVAEEEMLQQPKSLDVNGLKHEILSTYRDCNLVNAKLAQILKLLNLNRFELLSMNEAAKRIEDHKEEIVGNLNDIKRLQSLGNEELEDKARHAKEACAKLQSTGSSVVEHHNCEVFSNIFLLIRNTCLKIIKCRSDSDDQLQMFEYALRLLGPNSCGGLSFRKVVCDLLRIEDDKLEEFLTTNGNWQNFQKLFNSPDFLQEIKKSKRKVVKKWKRKIGSFDPEMDNRKNVKILQPDSVQKSGYSTILEVVNDSPNVWRNIKCEIKKLPPKDWKGVREIAFEAFKKGICEALDGKKDCFKSFLNLFSDEWEVKSEMLLKQLYNYDLQQQTQDYQEVCQNNDRKGSAMIRLIVLSNDHWAEAIKKEDIERTFHTGKWKHSGADCISKRMIKTYYSKSTANKDNLLRFCNAMFRTFDIPDKVRQTHLRMKFDKWKEQKLTYAFRPIWMATQFFNLLDKVVHVRLLDWVYINGVIPDRSFAYQKRKSAPLCRFKLLEHIAGLVHSGDCWYAISLDFRKAYEKVNPVKLCQIMASMGVPSKIISWVWCTLRRREFKIIPQQGSTYTSTGIPQGSSLSPLLFNIYTAHIHEKVRENVSLFQYTDDILILASDHDFHQAKNLAEKVCFDVIVAMNEYDAVLKNKSDVEVSFIGLKIRIPQNDVQCKNMEAVFQIFFDDMENQIKKRMEQLMVDIGIGTPVDGWEKYHTRLRPLFKKTFLSIKILQDSRSDDFLDKIFSKFHEKRMECLNNCLVLGEFDPSKNYAVLCEFGALPTKLFMQLEYDLASTRYKYYEQLKDTHPFPDNIRDAESQSTNEYHYVAFTDGSTLVLDNGERRAGAGVYFAESPGLKDENPSKRLRSDIMIGTAEMVAMVIAIKAVKDDLKNREIRECKVLLYSDRREVLLHLKKTGKIRHIHKYAEEFKKIAIELASDQVQIYLKWVKSHSQNKGKETKGNREADKRARMAAKGTCEPDNQYEELSLMDDLRKLMRDARKNFQEILNTESRTDQNLKAYLESVGGDGSVFRMKPWFQTKRIKALKLNDEDYRQYLKDRLEMKDLGEWEYFYAGYAK